MKIDRKYQPALVAGKPGLGDGPEKRAYLGRCLATAHDPRGGPGALLVATDGHSLAAVPIELEPGDVEGTLPAAAVVAAAKLAKANKLIDARVTLGTEQVGICAGDRDPDLTMPRAATATEAAFPPWHNLLADVPPTEPGDGVVAVGINVDYLAAIVKALGSGPEVTLTFRPQPATAQFSPNACISPIRVRAQNGGLRELAILMPVRP